MLNKTRVIAYDIGDSSKRRKALRLLRTFADCYQDSVFDLRVSHTEYQNLIHQLCNLLQQQDLLFSITFAPGSKSWQLGSGIEPLTEHMFIIK